MTVLRPAGIAAVCTATTTLLLFSTASCRRKEPEPPAAQASPAPASAPAQPPASVESPATAPVKAAAPAAEAKPAASPPAAPKPPRGPVFQLPTKNQALFRDEPERFFMFVDRYGADGKVSQVWQGGSYGYVRNPRTTAHGEVFTKFHEGIDIAPVDRNAAGEPLDTVHAISDGTVVFCSPNAASNYGNYIVVEHNLGEDWGSFYSLYAHLKRIDTTVDTPVKRGQAMALMGYTGDGIDRRRAHVHLELCLLLSDRFNDYWAKHYKAGNPNGNWHGHNLIGLDVSAFLKAARKDPGLNPAEFLKTAEPYYRVRIPNKTGQELEIARRYPWLRRPGDPGSSWEVTYNTAGVPLAIAPSAEPCAMPAVVWVKPGPGYHSWNTRNHLGGTGATATIAPEGLRYQQLVTGDF